MVLNDKVGIPTIGRGGSTIKESQVIFDFRLAFSLGKLRLFSCMQSKVASWPCLCQRRQHQACKQTFAGEAPLLQRITEKTRGPGVVKTSSCSQTCVPSPTSD